MNTIEKDLYFVAVKVFLEKDGKLLILKDNFGDWDLPGGRLTQEEFAVPLEKIVQRKMREELGNRLRYALGKPLVFMRHERQEAIPGNPLVRIFALGYEALWQSGEINLSPRHVEQEWVDIKAFDPKQYFRGGWLQGVQEYFQMKKL